MLPPFNATPYSPVQKVPVSGNHADLKRTRGDGPAPDLAVNHPRPETEGYMLPPFNATPTCPFPQPTTSIPLWDHARKILGQPSYFHQTMLKHYPWDEKVPSFATGNQVAGGGEGQGRDTREAEDEDEAMEEDGADDDGDDDDRYEEEKDQEREPFPSRHHDCVLHVEQFLSDFSVQLAACKYWKDADALHQLEDLLKTARDQVCMLEQPQPADGDV